MPTDSATSRRVVAARMTEQKAFELRLGGMSYSEIARQLGVSRSCAHVSVTRQLEEVISLRDGDREKVRALELERLDVLLMVAMRRVVKGDLDAIGRVLQIQQRRAAYLGLDAPTKTEIDTRVVERADEMTDEQLQAIASKGITEMRDSAAVAQPVHTRQVSGSTPDLATNEKDP